MLIERLVAARDSFTGWWNNLSNGTPHYSDPVTVPPPKTPPPPPPLRD